MEASVFVMGASVFVMEVQSFIMEGKLLLVAFAKALFRIVIYKQKSLHI
tara:strand:+ start:245 stop:391 length:147 start_codon:yes stop_codon:yes gene_type:complete